MNARRLLAVTALLGLAAFYAHVARLAADPEVGALYRLHYIERNLRHWNHGRGPEVRLGETLEFAQTQRHLSRRGWAAPEAWGVWSDGASAEIHLRIGGAERPRRVVLDVVPFTAPSRGLSGQRVAVAANGRALGEHVVARPQRLEFDLPPSVLDGTDGLLRLRFSLPDAVSPAQLELGADDRRLGLGVVRMTLS